MSETRTLGVDLASQAAGTAVAVIRWSAARATLEHHACGADDSEIVRRAADVAAVGIDAPFGWPTAFLDMVEGRAPLGLWDHTRRDDLRFRRTDHAVKAAMGRWPLSVSSDLIAIPAMRCQGLLELLAVTDRSGDGRAFEVYPRAGLHRWGFAGSGYKGRAKVNERSELWAALRQRAPWLDVPSTQDAERASSSHDAFDAVIAALLARAAACGLVDEVPAGDRELARREGWIVLPRPGSLDELPTASVPARRTA